MVHRTTKTWRQQCRVEFIIHNWRRWTWPGRGCWEATTTRTDEEKQMPETYEGGSSCQGDDESVNVFAASSCSPSIVSHFPYLNSWFKAGRGTNGLLEDLNKDCFLTRVKPSPMGVSGKVLLRKYYINPLEERCWRNWIELMDRKMVCRFLFPRSSITSVHNNIVPHNVTGE